MTNAVLSLRDSLRDIGEVAWSRLTGAAGEDATYNPFLSYGYLSALEESGCVGESSGWVPKHFVVQDEETGTLLGAAPAYLKSNSQGEYVFDHGWADAFERAGGRYYPKLQVSVPFTPATGPRLLATRDTDPDTIRRALAAGLKSVAVRNALSSVHVTFAQERDIDALANEDYLLRTDQQFHFVNPGYASYEDFLGQLRSSKRKALKRERRDALENGIEIDWLTGRDLTEEIWDQFFVFYMDTGRRKWGRPYLNRTFFSLIGERMANDILLVMARRNGRYIAGAINFIGSDRLFGRHWGCVEDQPFLHFEVCYHQAIDFAIERKLAVVEAGAQGEHKLARGYIPVTTHSAHFVAHPGLRRAIADYLAHERRDVADVGAYLSEHTPFRKTEEHS
ncbi:GNAT family N-acetyltransferase [Limoniibacter endophyticus]|uniref:GNAT family N-acetyltransferase n=1 Tax=Limoniibacter endophyticus TaxID=1565040 RepID=UPI00361D5D38